MSNVHKKITKYQLKLNSSTDKNKIALYSNKLQYYTAMHGGSNSQNGPSTSTTTTQTIPVTSTTLATPTASTTPTTQVTYHHIQIGTHNIFYREAGDPQRMTILLLHGFPTSSHQFRNLIPLLADKYHIIAPDFPGFGFSDAPLPTEFNYTFDNLAQVTDQFTEALHINKYILYLFDYGAPIALRIAQAHPERVAGLIIQNGNAYEIGLTTGWDPIKKYWSAPNKENREALRTSFLSPSAIKGQYEAGVPPPLLPLIAPETYTLDSALLARPNNDDIQLNLLLDYANNIPKYPTFHTYLRKHKPPTLIVWGSNDPFFNVAGAKAYKQDLPDAEMHFYDTGHFALETHIQPIAQVIKEFLAKIVQ